MKIEDFEFDMEGYTERCKIGLHYALSQQMENHINYFQKQVGKGKSVEEAAGLLAIQYGRLVQQSLRTLPLQPGIDYKPEDGIQSLLSSYAFSIAAMAIQRSAVGKN